MPHLLLLLIQVTIDCLIQLACHAAVCIAHQANADRVALMPCPGKTYTLTEFAALLCRIDRMLRCNSRSNDMLSLVKFRKH